MARRAKARPVMKLLAAGLSQNATAKSQHVSKHSVGEVAHAARDVGLDWEESCGVLDTVAHRAVLRKS